MFHVPPTSADASDSDSDRLKIVERPQSDAFSDDVVVRRSARRRRTTSKFNGDFVVGDDDGRSGGGPPEKKRRTDSTSPGKWAPPTSRVSQSAEIVEPEALLSLVERTQQIVKPGDFAVKLAAGPDQYVTIDGVEYLQGLGYDFDLVEVKIKKNEEEEEDGEDEMIGSFASTMKDDRSNHHHHHPSVRRIKKIHLPSSHRLKEVVDEPDQFSSASAYSTEDERQSASSLEIDVGTVKDQMFIPNNSKRTTFHNSKTNSLRRHNRIDHNMMEQARRREMAELFRYLRSTLRDEERTSNMAKVRILLEATDMIKDMKKEDFQLATIKRGLRLVNEQLLIKRSKLMKRVAKNEIKKENETA